MPCGALQIHGKVVLVTGGGSGINLAFAKQALERGAKVLIADLRLTGEGRAFIDDNPSGNVFFVECDVSKRSELEKLITVSREQFGLIPEVFVAGAGVFEPRWSSWWDDTEEDHYAQFQINALHPLKLARIATRALLAENKKGVVLIVASLAGYTGAFAAP
jgi:NAD(P)-dependent dehydrogenase (short-subunit alcohol dehydrogenase family)